MGTPRHTRVTLSLPDSSSLTNSFQGDATYLIVKEDNTLTDFGLNAICTHLGCVVPWNKAENKFICTCHGSQYNAEGKVIRGPAPLVRPLSSPIIASLCVSELTRPHNPSVPGSRAPYRRR
jgi:Rieske Fe-S protein